MPSELDAVLPHRGPCAFCGHPDARHRLFAAIVGRHKAGESVDELAEDYGLSRSMVEQVLRRKGMLLCI